MNKKESPDPFGKIMSRSEGSKILRKLFPNRILSLKVIYRKSAINFKEFSLNKDEIFGITVRRKSDERRVGLFFSKSLRDIYDFINKFEEDNYFYEVRISPLKENIKFYGSYIFDKRNFGDKIIINLSRRENAEYIKLKGGESFKFMPRDISPDFSFAFKNNQIEMKESELKDIIPLIKKDIILIKDFLEINKKDNLSIPVAFIISSKKKIDYLGMGIL